MRETPEPSSTFWSMIQLVDQIRGMPEEDLQYLAGILKKKVDELDPQKDRYLRRQWSYLRFLISSERDRRKTSRFFNKTLT